MRRILLAAATIVNLFASPALAQAFDPSIGSGSIVGQAAASPQIYMGPRGPAHHLRRSYDAHAQSPGAQLPDAAYGQRWPGARYDANGYYIDPNSPGRW
jgi:hypothetical protein